jgi:hypothetical protein
MITLLLKLSNTLLKLLKSLCLSLAGLASCKSIARSLHGDGVVRVFDNDRRKWLVAFARVDARDRRVCARGWA